GLDALEATQDVATGTQIGTVIGLNPWSKVPMRNTFASVDVYTGRRTKRSFMAARVEANSRIDLDEGDWSHLVGGGRAAWYFKPRPIWTWEGSVEGAAVWRSIV